MNDHRKARRRQLTYRAHIIARNGVDLRSCTVRDVSARGARIMVETVAEIPEEFVLILSERGRPRRQCQVVWRDEAEIGVRFA